MPQKAQYALDPGLSLPCLFIGRENIRPSFYFQKIDHELPRP